MATGKSKAKIEISESAAKQFESTLRNGLVASGAYDAGDNAPVHSYGPVDLDADEAARFVEHLRDRMSAAKAPKLRKAVKKAAKKR